MKWATRRLTLQPVAQLRNMKRRTIKCGTWGAFVAGIAGSAVIVAQFAHGENAALYNLVWNVICFPVDLAWKVLFHLLGVSGDQRMAFIVPIYGSAIFYFACIGFFAGTMLEILLNRHATPD